MEWQKRWKLRPTGLAKQLEKDGATVSSAAPAVSSAEEEKASSSQPPSPSPPPQPTAVASTAASTSPAAGTAAATEPSPTKSMWGEEMVGVRKAASSAASAAGDAVSSAAKGAQLGGTKSFTPVTSFVGVGRGAKGVTTVGRVGTARGVAAIPARAGAGGVGAGVGVGGELGVSGVGGGGRGGGKAAVATSTGSAAAEGGSKGLPVTSPGAGGGGGLKAVPTAVAAAGRGAGGKGLSTGAGTKAGVGGGGKGTVASGTPAPWAKGVSPAPAGEGGGGMGGGGGGGMGGGGVGGMGGGGGGVGYSKAGTLSKVEAVTHTLGAKGAQAAGATAIPMGKKGTMSATAPWGGLRGSSPAKFGTGTGTLDTRGSMKGSEGGGSFKGDEAGKLSGRVTAGKVHTGGQGETMDLSSETGKLVKAAAAQFEAGIGEQVKIWLERDVSGASTRKIDANVDALVAEGEEQYEGIADSLDDDSTAFFEWDLESLQKRTWIWLELMLRERFPTGQTLGDLLADGEILVRLMKVLRPRLRLPDISNLLPKGAETTPALYKIGSRLGYYAVSNAATFLRFCREAGISDVNLFTPPDLVEKKDTRRVCLTIRLLSVKARSARLAEYDLDNVMDEEVNFPSAKVEEILSTLTAQPARRPEPSLVDIYEGIEDEPEIGPGIWRSESGTSLISVSSQGEEPLTPHSIGSRGSIPGTPGSVGGRHIIPGCIRPSAVKGSPDPWSEIPPLFLDGYDLSTTTKGLVGTVSAASKPPRLPERELKTREDSKSMISDPKTRADTKRVFDMKGGLSLKPIPDLNATSIRRTFPELKSGSPPYKKGGSMVKGELDSRMVSEQEAVGVKRTFSELKSGLTSGPTEQSTHVSGPDGLAPTDHFHASEFRDDTSKDLKGQKTGVSAMQLAAAFGGVRTASPISIPKKKKSTPQVTPSDSPSSSASDGVSYLNMKLKLKPTGFFHKPHPMDRHPMGVGAGSESKHMVTGEGPDSNAVTRAQMERQTIPSSVTEVESNVLTQDQGDTDGNMLRDGPEDVLPTPEVSDFNMDILSEKDQAINKDDGKEVEPGVMAKQIVSGIRVSSPPHPMFRGSEENHWGASMSESVFETQSNDVFTPVDDGQSVDNDEMLEQNEEVSLSFNECLRTEDNDGTTIKNYDDLGVVDSHTEIRPAAGQQITLALSPVCAPAVPDLEVEELLLDQVQRTADGSMVDHSCQSQDNPSIECVPEAIEPDFVIAKQLTHSEAASVEATMANVVAAEGAVLDVTDGAGLLDEQQGAGGTKLETDKNMHPPSSTIDEESVHSTVLDVVAGEEQVLERQQGGEVRTVVEEKDADSTQESLMESVNEGMMFSKDMELEERGEKDHQESSADSSIAPSTLVNPSALQLQGETTQPLETREQSCQVGERDTKKMPVPWGSIAAVAAAGLGIVLTIVNRARQDQHHSFGGLHMAEYRIQQGDTLSKISRELGYTRWQEIAQINPDVKNPNIIFPNDVLRVSP